MAHIHEKIDFTASVYIVYGKKVLLHMHKKLGIWLQPGGHIELDEDPIQAVMREAKEETGLDIELVGQTLGQFETKFGARELMPPRHLNRHFFDEARTHEHVDMVYFARAGSDVAVPEEADGEVRWFTKEELTDPSLDILPDVRRYALSALAELSS
jgi:8-oxo-dGTP pyrophosphatase MutT (NUDIX family)